MAARICPDTREIFRGDWRAACVFKRDLLSPRGAPHALPLREGVPCPTGRVHGSLPPFDATATTNQPHNTRSL
jgi:hypothetical protein